MLFPLIYAEQIMHCVHGVRDCVSQYADKMELALMFSFVFSFSRSKLCNVNYAFCIEKLSSFPPFAGHILK